LATVICIAVPYIATPNPAVSINDTTATNSFGIGESGNNPPIRETMKMEHEMRAAKSRTSARMSTATEDVVDVNIPGMM
jgi:hypothetical protein